MTTTKKAARGTRWAPKKGRDDTQSVLSAELSAASGGEVPFGAGRWRSWVERRRQPGDDIGDGTSPASGRGSTASAAEMAELLGHVEVAVGPGRDR